MRSFSDKQQLLEPVLLLLLTPVYYLVPWELMPGPAEAWGVPFLCLYVLLLPGSSLRKTFAQDWPDPVARVTLSLFLGLFYFLLLSFIWALTGLDLGWLVSLLPAGLLAAAEIPLFTNKQPGWKNKDLHSRPSLVITLTLLAAVFVAVRAGGIPDDFLKDTLDHAGYVNEINDTGEAFPNTALYKNAGEDGVDIRKGLLHILYGLSCRLLEVDALRCLDAWNPFMAVLMALAVYTTALLLFRHRWIAVLSVVFFLLGTADGLAGTTLRLLFYPNRIGQAVFFLMLVPVLGFLGKSRPRDLILAACLSFAAAGIHILYAVLSALAIGIVAVWRPCFPDTSSRRHYQRTIVAGLAVAAGFLPYALFRYLTAYHEANELHTGIQGVVYVADGLFIAEPWKILVFLGPVGLFSFLAAVLLWRDRHWSAGLGYLIAAGFTIPLLLLNPFLLPVMYKALTYLVIRVPYLFPYYMLAAVFFIRFFKTDLTVRPNHLKSTAGRAVFALLIVVVAVQSGRHFRTAFVNRPGEDQIRKENYRLWEDGLSRLARLPAGLVVASDPLTSYSIPALTPHYVVCTLDQHAPPGDRLLSRRLQTSRDILSPYVPMSATTRLLGETGARLVVVNSRIAGSMPLAFWEMGLDVTPRIRSKFLSRPDLFEALYDEDGFLILRWNGRRSGEVGPTAGEAGAPQSRERRPSSRPDLVNPWFLETIPDSLLPFGRPAGEATLAAVRLNGPAGPDGRTVSLGLLWSGEGEYPFGNYVVTVRFDHQSPDLPLGGRPFPKIARKLKEVRSGRLYRYRLDHKIESGFLNPDTWPAGGYVLDMTTIRLPESLAPGEYGVFVKLHSTVYAPTYRLRDIFYDDDIYQGVEIGSISVH